MTFSRFAQWNIRAASLLALVMVMALYYHLVAIGMMQHARMTSSKIVVADTPCVTFCIVITESKLRQTLTVIFDSIQKKFGTLVLVVGLLFAYSTPRITSVKYLPQRLQYYYAAFRKVWKSYTLYPSLFEQGILAPRLYA